LLNAGIEQLSKKCGKFFQNKAPVFFLDILIKFFKEYNNDYRSSIKMTLIQASKKETEDRVYFNLYRDIKQINKKQSKLEIL